LALDPAITTPPRHKGLEALLQPVLAYTNTHRLKAVTVAVPECAELQTRFAVTTFLFTPQHLRLARVEVELVVVMQASVAGMLAMELASKNRQEKICQMISQ
jgi:hypothetical protein